jgi:hypothetical protein
LDVQPACEGKRQYGGGREPEGGEERPVTPGGDGERETDELLNRLVD